jgi:uroporphyrinogen decarboxylase
MNRLGVSSRDALLARLGSDFRWVDARYCGPELRTFPDGSNEGIWGERWGGDHVRDGFFQDIVYQPYAGITELRQLDHVRWPSADWFDTSGIAAQCEQLGPYAICAGSAGYLDFLNGIGRLRGQEQVLLDVAVEDPVYLELVERCFKFAMDQIEDVLVAAGGRIDLVWCGEDLGTQEAPIISPRSFDKLFADKVAAYFNLAHRHKARTIMHVCGAIRPFIPRLIELGLDVLDVVQVSAVGMDLRRLRDDFGDRLIFSGTMCVQTTLPHGTPEDVRREVRVRKELFPDGGLILGPCNTIEIGTPIENVLAMYEEAGSLRIDG